MLISGVNSSSAKHLIIRYLFFISVNSYSSRFLIPLFFVFLYSETSRHFSIRIENLLYPVNTDEVHHTFA